MYAASALFTSRSTVAMRRRRSSLLPQAMMASRSSSASFSRKNAKIGISTSHGSDDTHASTLTAAACAALVAASSDRVRTCCSVMRTESSTGSLLNQVVHTCRPLVVAYEDTCLVRSADWAAMRGAEMAMMVAAMDPINV